MSGFYCEIMPGLLGLDMDLAWSMVETLNLYSDLDPAKLM